jgi:hypothetical protein
MMLWLWPWTALAEARATAERVVAANQRLRGANVEMQRLVDELRVERDAAWAKLARRSAGVSRGNRTRALRARGGLLPAPINEPASAASRNQLTG